MSARRTFRQSLALTVALVTLCIPAAGGAQTLSADEAKDFLGTWKLAMEFQGNPVELSLELAEHEGEVKAALAAAFTPEPQLIDTITRTDDGLKLAYDANFGGNALRVEIEAAREGEGLKGTFGDESGLFSAEFTGERAAEAADIVAKAAELAAEKAAQGPQRTRRFGSVETKVMLAGDNELRVLHGSLKLDTPDHQALLDTKPGEVFQYPGSRAMKLYTDADLLFGDTRVQAHNFAPDYPGVYGLWLKRVGEEEWHLVFNVKADLWGTMHEPATDVAEVPLEVGLLDEAVEELRVDLLAEDGGGSIRFVWGTTSWTATFRLE